MQKWKIEILALALLLTALPLAAASSLKAVQDSYSKRRDFTAEFTQDTHQVVLRKDIHFTGKVSYSRDLGVRMDVYGPQKQVIILKGSTVWVYLPDDGTVSMQEIPKEFASQNVLAFFAGLSSLEGDYKVAVEGDNLKLKPKKGVGDLTIKVDSQNLIKAIELRDATGNKSDIQLKNYRFDQGLKPDLFKQQAPKASQH